MKKNLLIFTFIFALFSQVAFTQTLQESRAAYGRKDYVSALAGFTKLAEGGDAAAQVQLASMYSLGQGTTKDEQVAHSWAKKSAEQGNVTGQFMLGLHYSNGIGVAKDGSLSVYWYGKAIEQGNVAAMYNLANLYKDGRGVPQDYPKAIELLNSAIVKYSGYPFTYLTLARMYSNGQGVSENQHEALRLATIGLSKISTSSASHWQAQKQIDEINQKISYAGNANQPASSQPPIAQMSQSKLEVRALSNQDPRKDCEANLATDNRLSIIGAKISLRSPSEISFTMLADQSLPSLIEQKAISVYADGVRKCTKDAEAFRQQNYSKEINTILSQFDINFMDVAIELYNKKITYGKFNTRLQQLDKDLADKLTDLNKQASVQKNEQDQANRARADAMRDAQRRQDQARQADEQRIQQQRQVEQDRINANRSRWVARCNLDKTNAYEQSKVQYKNECDNTYRNASNTAINRMGVIACALSIDKQAEEYAKVTFDACMSGAP